MTLSGSSPSSPNTASGSTFFDRYFGKGTTASIDDARSGLTNPSITSRNYEGEQEKIQSAILEQYKLYVEMADRISARRALTNTFFITLNTAVFTVIGAFWKNSTSGHSWLLIFPAIALTGQCLAWFWLLR